MQKERKRERRGQWIKRLRERELAKNVKRW